MSPNKPYTILVVGVNGSGKTTTVGKLAHLWKNEKKKCSIAACDTFRAAAVEQLQEWGKRLDVPVITGKTGADPAGLAYDAYQTGKANGDDVLLIDTAGRLHNKAHLMDELEKIVRVLKKLDDHIPHEMILVIDATIGQNAIQQLEQFVKAIDVSGMIITKLDGTAKAGILISLCTKFDIPVHAIGIGETVDDLQTFSAQGFADNLLGLAKFKD